MTLATPLAEPARGRPGRWRFICGLALLAVLIVVPTAAAVVSYDRMVRSNAEREMQNTADLAGVFLEQQNASTAALISSVAVDSAMDEALTSLAAGENATARATVNRVLRTLEAATRDLSTVIVLDADLKVLGDLPARVPVGYDLGRQSWFPDIAEAAPYSTSSVFRSPVSSNDVSLITVPVRGGSGDLLGYVGISRKVNGYQRYVDSYAEGRGVRLSVLDDTGQLVADSEGAAPTGLARATRLARGATVLAGSGQIVAASSSSPGGGDGWRVVAQESETEAMRPAVFFRAVAIGTAAVILAGAVLVATLRRRANWAALQATRSLGENQRRMRDLANSAPGVLLRLERDGTVDFCSVAAEELLGVPADDLVGRDLAEFLVAESDPDTATRLATLVRTGEQQVFLARTRGPGGSRRIVECNFRVRAEAGDPGETEIWGSLQDVTDRLSARDQVEQLFQLSTDFMAVADLDGRLVQTNPVWSASLGPGPEELLGRRFEEVFPGSEETDRQRVAGQLARLARDPGVATFENRFVRDGVTRTLLWTAASDPDRRLIYAVGRDITSQKELQNALSETRDQAIEASRLKSEFVATMSHEIRTPMNGVIGLTDLLLGTPLTETQRRYVEGVRTAGDALLTVINDILDFSRIEAGRLLLDRVDFRLEDVVDDVVTLVRQNAAAKGLELTVDYEPGVPFALNGDPGRLRQILLNLTHNAVKFTEHGGVSIAVRPGRPRSDGQVPVNFAVSDTGIGIEPARLDLLFEPFRQADEGTSRAYGGTGLGLSISRRLADLMGGTIRASSELGGGATFVAELVFAPAEDWGRSVRGRDARGLAVLIVDDNEVNRLVMTTQLTRWGMRPVSSESASEAMDLLTNRSAPAGGYDLAVIDMHMPDRDGLTLISQIRAVPALANLPVILVSSGEDVDEETVAAHNISAHLTKPVRQSDLFGALTRVSMPTTEPAEAPAAEALPPAPASPERAPAVTPETQHPRRGRFRLLLVEDNDINQTVALGILSQLGYQVDVAGHGEQALTMTAQHAYDAILMDCQMPVMDGYTATVELRKRTATQNVPIIAMTAATFAADRQRCFDSGMDDFIAKPVRSTTLQATLNRWLRTGDDAPPAGRAERTQPMERHYSQVRDKIAAFRDSEHVAVIPPASVGLLEETAPQPVPAVPAQSGPRAGSSQERREVPAIADTDERIAELLGDGTEFEVELVRDIISSFLSRTVDLFQRLSLAVSADDPEGAYLHAHSLAGAGLNLGTVRVVEIARLIEAEAKAGRAGQCGQLLVDLEVALDQSRVRLRDIAANLPDAP
ncbi:response regulator [Kineosporia sp. J2-2]|uniref:histidine kinase n=1 Tax=Kineosporia corallincola TaxID=2835133 RepID=A0ABS5TH62_9ACTN|nr:response regulator [Kineosporia corallincola]MBT0770427.1 response regulator [Kineosporia corallincola]